MARNIFNTIQVRKPKTSNFDMSHDLKLGLKMGQLVPVSILECIPGDKWDIRTEVMLRMAPMVAPVMHNVNVSTHYFFVPNRLVWSNWEKFITDNNGKGNVPAPPMMPAISAANAGSGTLPDYLGLPIGKDIPAGQVSAIPFAAYQLIFNEYYRDQNLHGDIGKNGTGDIPLTDGIQAVGSHTDRLLTMRRRAWEHDYFTASLPFAQKGDAIDIPLLGDAPIKRGGGSGAETRWVADTAGGGVISVKNQPTPGVGSDYLYADMDEVSGATINDLRRAFRLQEWLEKMARGGSRYIEQVLVHFGVRSSDRRLDRPEYLGGNKQPVIISEVLQTSSSDQTTPQGTMAGHGISASTGKNISYFCEEHGYIIGIMSIMPKTAYQQGIPKHFMRTTHLDYAWPTFAHIGEQEVLNKEIYFDPLDATNGGDNGVFGYVPRYSEYRYQPSRVAGDFRTTLNFWHLGRIFGTRPALNSTFIECKPRNDIFAVKTDIQNVWGHCFHKIRVNRRLPKYGTPTL